MFLNFRRSPKIVLQGTFHVVVVMLTLGFQCNVSSRGGKHEITSYIPLLSFCPAEKNLSAKLRLRHKVMNKNGFKFYFEDTCILPHLHELSLRTCTGLAFIKINL